MKRRVLLIVASMVIVVASAPRRAAAARATRSHHLCTPYICDGNDGCEPLCPCGFPGGVSGRCSS